MIHRTPFTFDNDTLMRKVPAALHTWVTYVAAVIFAVAAWSCAGQVPPPGGPVDSVAPEIVRTFPEMNSTNVATSYIDLEFSEYVDRRSVEEAIFISPYLGPLEFDWGSTDVRIKFTDTLRRNTTYVVSVGTDVRDVNAQNRMALGYTLAFSTGDSIDHGSMNGRIFDEQPEGVMVFAYALQQSQADSLDPSLQRPDYIMQTGKGGFFRFSNVALGLYRIIAVRDEYRNLVYDRSIDQFGVYTHDVVLTPEHPSESDIWVRLSKEDTVQPFVTSAIALHATLVEVRFSEPLDSISFDPSAIRLEDTLYRKPVPVAVMYLHAKDASLVSAYLTEPLDSATSYRAVVGRVYDCARNPLDSTHTTVVFQGSSTLDTTRLGITFAGLSDSSRGIPVDTPIEFLLSKPLRNDTRLVSLLSLRDSLGRAVPCTVDLRSPVEGLLKPHQHLAGKAWHRLSYRLDSLEDVKGHRGADSTVQLRFETLDLRTTGSIDGVVVDSSRKESRGGVFVIASSTNLNPVTARTIHLNRPGPFSITLLPEGQYRIQAFLDRDSSGSYSAGRPFPYKVAESFAFYPDTVKVRARWALEGVRFTFR